MSDSPGPRGPVLIDLEDQATAAPSPADAAPIADPDAGFSTPSGAAMQTAATLAARRPSRLARWFWSALTALITGLIGLAFWDYVTALIVSRPILGYAVAVGFGLVLSLLAIIALREAAAFRRLGRIDGFHRRADDVIAASDLEGARALGRDLQRFYRGHSETKWGSADLPRRLDETFDADAAVWLTEDALLVPLDAAASREVTAAARQVATVTALVPLALADVATALVANLRMIRRIAEIYGGRSGTLGAWRLTRVVMSHLVATGAVAIGDDMIEPFVGGSLLGKVSRRFGEGLVNGALTVRVGIAAIEVCRPLPFSKRHQPKTRSLIQEALSGMFRRTS